MLAVAEVVDEYWGGEGIPIHEVQALFNRRGQEQSYMPAPLFADRCMELLAKLGEHFGIVGRDAFMRALCNQNRASWWIDHRGDYYAVVKDIIDQIKADAPADTQENSIQAADARREAVLCTEGDAVCEAAIELAIAGGCVRIAPPEKREDFQTVMKLMGCKWNADRRRYVFRPGPRDGDILDRAAEITHALVAEGFKVCLFDEEARRRALEHDFRARQTRWIGLDGDCLTIEWKRPDDFYESARDLPRSRYKDGRVIVPVSMADDVLDWAEENGFCIDDAVTKLLENRREALVNAIVLRNPKAAGTGETGLVSKRPGTLRETGKVEVDDDLKDD